MHGEAFASWQSCFVSWQSCKRDGLFESDSKGSTRQVGKLETEVWRRKQRHEGLEHQGKQIVLPIASPCPACLCTRFLSFTAALTHFLCGVANYDFHTNAFFQANLAIALAVCRSWWRAVPRLQRLANQLAIALPTRVSMLEASRLQTSRVSGRSCEPRASGRQGVSREVVQGVRASGCQRGREPRASERGVRVSGCHAGGLLHQRAGGAPPRVSFVRPLLAGACLPGRSERRARDRRGRRVGKLGELGEPS